VIIDISRIIVALCGYVDALDRILLIIVLAQDPVQNWVCLNGKPFWLVLSSNRVSVCNVSAGKGQLGNIAGSLK
jgi:hypothetical protein